MQTYVNALMIAARFFPLVAFVVTLPYIIVQYHRYGSILVLRMVFLYSFVLYIMCATLLTMLPTPATASDAVAQQQAPQYIPLSSIRGWLAATHFDLLSPSTWKGTFYNRLAFYILANVVMTVPLGMYLRYYFEFSFGKTVVITLGYSLILELIQLSGLFGLYPVAYRMFDVDDLLTNTLGGVIGYGLIKPFLKHLPSQQQLNSIALRKGQRVSFLRRMTAAAIDWLVVAGAAGTVAYFHLPFRRYLLSLSWKWRLVTAGMIYIGAVLFYFVVGEWVCGGRTLGKGITHLKTVDSQSGKKPRLWQVFLYDGFLYFGYPSLVVIAASLFMILVKKFVLESRIFTYGLLLMLLYGAVMMVAIISVTIRHKQLPHAALSRLNVISTLRGAPEPDAQAAAPEPEAATAAADRTEAG